MVVKRMPNQMTDTPITPSSGDIYVDLDIPHPEHGEVRRSGENTYVWDSGLKVWIQTKYAKATR